MKEYYTINDLCLITGLTSRTVRNYICKGMLEGEKIDGVWQFTSEQIDAFVSASNVCSSIQAKKNAIIHDFMLNRMKKSNQMCVIVDLPKNDNKEIMTFLCKQMNTGEYGPELRFFFEGKAKYVRVILEGQAEEVLKLLNRFCNGEESGESNHEV